MVAEGRKVKVRIIARTDSGDRINIGAGRGDVLEFIIGSGQMLSGIDELVASMDVGQSRTVRIPAANAFGLYNPNLIETVPVKEFPHADRLPLGQYITVRTSGGNARMKVLGIEGGLISFDCNHELAGKDITYEVELLEDEGCAISAVEAERHYHEHGCSCGCDKLRESLAS